MLVPAASSIESFMIFHYRPHSHSVGYACCCMLQQKPLVEALVKDLRPESLGTVKLLLVDDRQPESLMNMMLRSLASPDRFRRLRE
ncbi:hypothetical protein DMENIID0001_036350 [Sergentomyia squamirostris]